MQTQTTEALSAVISSPIVAVFFFFLSFALLLFIYLLILLFPVHKYLFKLIRGTILLFALEHAVHTFSAVNL